MALERNPFYLRANGQTDMEDSEPSVQLLGRGRRGSRVGWRHQVLPTVGQVRVLGQLLQLPAEVRGLVHALLLGYLQDHVFL